MSHAEADGPRSVAFQFDDFVRTLDHLLVQFAPLFRVVLGADQRIQFAKTHSGYVDARPDGNWNKKRKFVSDILHIFACLLFGSQNTK